MSEMLSVSLIHHGIHDTPEALRRCLARGNPRDATREFLGHAERWAEVEISAFTIHPDARCGTSEELFLRLLADAMVEAGASYKGTPLDAHYGEALWEMGFKITHEDRVIRVVELDYTPGEPEDESAGGEDDSVRAVVLVQAQLVPGIEGVTSFQSASWGGARRLDDEARGRRSSRKNARIHLVEADTWIQRRGGGLRRWEAGAWTRVTEEVPDSNLQDLLVDRHGDTWLAYKYGAAPGLYRLGEAGLEPVALIQKQAFAVEALLEARGSLWVGAEKGLFELQGGAVQRKLTTREGLAGNKVHALDVLPDGALVVGTAGGFSLLPIEGEPETVKKGLVDKTVNAVAVSPDGTLWLSGHKGTTARSPEGWLTKWSGERVSCLVALPDGSAFTAAYEDDRLYGPGGGDYERTRAFEPWESVAAATVDAEGVVWLVSWPGMLIRVAPGEVAEAFQVGNVAETGPGERVRVTDDAVWIVTEEGAHRLSRAALDEARANASDSAPIVGEGHLRPFSFRG
ncbi:MAG: hypothetical protein H6741_19555 [Alphaproteobacteria bacterium]|nr:hypothetical protein [Alphaproteobacteria bacterium]